MTNELRALEEPYGDDIAQALARYPRIDGELLALFRTFANSKRFLEKGVSNLLDRESPLTLREREIVILRVTANNKCEYEWGVHIAVFSNAARFTKKQIRDVCSSRVDPLLWSSEELALLEAVDQLCFTGRIAGKNLVAFQQNWTVEKQLEIIALCGTYHTISFVANVAELPCEPFAARFPA